MINLIIFLTIMLCAVQWSFMFVTLIIEPNKYDNKYQFLLSLIPGYPLWRAFKKLPD